MIIGNESLPSPNRHERRRHKALTRKRARLARRRQAALPAALLASATIGILATANLEEAQAQCVTTGSTVNCSANGTVQDGVIEGVDFFVPPVDTINIFGLTGTIAPAANVDAVYAYTDGTGESLTVNVATGDFQIVTQGYADGLRLYTTGDNSPIVITSSGTFNTSQGGIYASTGLFVFAGPDLGLNSGITIVNSANLTSVDDDPFEADTQGDNSPIMITNTGNLVSGLAASDEGFEVDSDGNNSPITIINSGSVSVGDDPFDIDTDGNNSAITIINSGALYSAGPGGANDGFDIDTEGTNSPITITNSGSVTVLSSYPTGDTDGFSIVTRASNSPVHITNTGDILVTGNLAIGIDVDTTGNNITIDNRADISAQGQTGQGINADITGDGNISIAQVGNIVSVATGISANITGNGIITITSAGDITTTGNNADGIYASEAGNGSVTVNVTGNIRVSGETTNGIFVDENGIGDIFVTVNGSVTNASPTTSGASDAFELRERDDGSVVVNTSGDINSNDDVFEIREYGSGDLIINSAGNLTTVFQNDDLFDTRENGSGDLRITSVGTLTSIDDAFDVSEDDDGDLIIRSTGTIIAGLNGNGSGDGFDVGETGDGDVFIVSVGDITTSGDTRGDGFDVQEGGPGGIQITSTGNVTATGLDANGFDITNDAPSPNVVTIIDGTISGGSGAGAGVNLLATQGTTALNTRGTVTITALTGIAVNDGTADTTINNFGTLTTVSNGAIELGGGTNAFNNMGGGIFNAGGIVNLGAGNLFNNSGTLSPGGSGAIQTTAITGNLVQKGGGIFLATVDPGAGTGDLVTVTGTANLSGLVQAEAINPVTGMRSVTILSAAGGTTNNGLGLLASPALQASLSFPNANDVVLNYSIDFSAGGLNPNQTALANGLNAAANAGARDLDPVFLPLLNNIFTVGDYRNALNQLLPEVVLNTGTATLFASEGFVDNLFSCRLAGQNHTALSEGECYWARPQGRFLDRESDANTIGFDETSGGLAAGAQVAVAPNW
ncbi:MAG: hypothetical protein AAGL24_24145, partial [Pseudomonadota bacterium]